MLMTIFSLIVLYFSTAIHEIAHGSIAFLLGDPTAKEEGRLTLNPLRHLDPFGSVILPAILFFLTQGQGPIFGWAKPVPINPYNFYDRKWGLLKVSIAGPATNFLLALIFGFLIRFLSLPYYLAILFGLIAIYNFAWGIFNLIPIPPLDGSHILFTFLPESFSKIKLFLQQYGFFLLIFFIFFGLDFIFRGALFLYSLIVGQAFSF